MRLRFSRNLYNKASFHKKSEAFKRIQENDIVIIEFDKENNKTI